MINNKMIQWNDLLPSVKQGGKAVYGDCLGGGGTLHRGEQSVYVHPNVFRHIPNLHLGGRQSLLLVQYLFVGQGRSWE